MGLFLTRYSASIYSRDMYQTRFWKDPMSKEEGRRYRELVIGKGGKGPAIALLKSFLGRVPNGAAFAKALAKQSPETLL
jgi:metallopeptidase MepB